jgi:hypothetical protein
MFGVALFLLLDQHVVAQQQASNGAISAVAYGADPTGAGDSTSSIRSAAAAAGAAHSVLYFPNGIYRVSSTIDISSSVLMESNATIRAMTVMGPVIQIGSTASLIDATFTGGIIDANNLANEGIFLRRYQHIKVQDVTVLNALVNGFHFGDSTISDTSYEAIVDHIHTRRTMGNLQTGSVGLFIDSNAGDGNYSQSVLVGSDTGIKVLTGNNFFTDIHVWSAAPTPGWMTVGFDDYGNGNFWKGCEADTVQTYGMQLRGFNTIIQGCAFYNNSQYGVDNGMIGIHFVQQQPFATIEGSRFFGEDSTHRLAKDIDGAASGVVTTGNQNVNVTQASTFSVTVSSSLTATDTIYATNFSAVPQTATAVKNTTSTVSLGASWYDSINSAANSYRWNIGISQTPNGALSASDLYFYTSGSLPQNVSPRIVYGANAATSSSQPNNSLKHLYQSSYFDGAAKYDSWSLQNVLGTGTTPSSTFTISHSGSPGLASVSVPALLIANDGVMSAAPRMTWTPFGNCSTQILGCQQSAMWRPTKPITLTQWTFNFVTPVKNCTTYPVLSLKQGDTILISATMNSSWKDYKITTGLPIAINPNNGSLQIVTTTAGVGCATDGIGMSNTIEYMMN